MHRLSPSTTYIPKFRFYETIPVLSVFEILYSMAGLKIDEFSRKKMDASANELIEEKSLAYSCLN